MTLPGSFQAGRVNNRQRVYAHLRDHGPATVEEIAAALDIPACSVEGVIYKTLADLAPLFVAVGTANKKMPGSPTKLWGITRPESSSDTRG